MVVAAEDQDEAANDAAGADIHQRGKRVGSNGRLERRNLGIAGGERRLVGFLVAMAFNGDESANNSNDHTCKNTRDPDPCGCLCYAELAKAGGIIGQGIGEAGCGDCFHFFLFCLPEKEFACRSVAGVIDCAGVDEEFGIEGDFWAFAFDAIDVCSGAAGHGDKGALSGVKAVDVFDRNMLIAVKEEVFIG